MIIEKIEDLCIQNGTTLTALCREITGSSGNLPTWKKDKIRTDWLREICVKFDVSSDYLLEIPMKNVSSQLSQDENDALLRYNRLNPDNKIKVQSYMVDLWERQKSNMSVAADTPLKKAK